LATSLKDKRVLITAGPTWVAIDNVRVISNIASGETGAIIANKMAARGAKVTLLLGPGKDYRIAKSIKLIKFKFFDELDLLINKLLKKNKYTAIIHAAAVADYKPISISKKKISSQPKVRSLVLKRTRKLISLLRRLNKHSLLVGFKFEPNLKRQELIKEAELLLKKAELDIVVANTLSNGNYLAYLVDKQKISGPLKTKNFMAGYLIKSIGSNHAGN
jgi:phosphopantothenoylcysteine decarboxylase/phosphopantothenate--cysteine ligase